MVKTFWKIATSAFFVVIWAQFSVDLMKKMMNFELNFDFFFKQSMLLVENNASIICPEKITFKPFIVFEKWIFSLRGLIFAIFFQTFVKLVVFKI